MIAEHGAKLLPDYRFESASGLWKHRAGPVEPPLRFSQMSYDADGVLTFPRHDDRAPASVYADTLDAARAAAVRCPPPKQKPAARAIPSMWTRIWFNTGMMKTRMNFR